MSFSHGLPVTTSSEEIFLQNFSSNSETLHLELLGYIEEMIPHYYMHSYILSRFKSSTTL